MLAMDARRRLSRLLSQAVHGDDMAPSLTALPPAEKRPLVLAFTGSGGVGKSSLIGRLIPLIRNEHLTAAVLACDPESPVTGGALLGDRFRLASDAVDEGVFIRSLATPSGQESIAQFLPVMVAILERFEFDVILIETVGAGQGDVAVRESADRTILLLQPESGDDLQWEKAGILEVADIVVIHKADLPGAEQTEAQIKSMLELGAHRDIPVLRVSSKDAESVQRLWGLLKNLPPNAERGGAVASRVLRLAHQQLDSWLRRTEASDEPAWAALMEQCRAGRLSDEQAAAQMLALASREFDFSPPLTWKAR
jgi:LAO/AO transport system ATPase